MGLDTESIAAASCTVGDNILAGTSMEVKGYDRVINGILFTGSTAIGDCAVEFFVDDLSIGKQYNTKLLLGNKDDIMPIQPRLVRAGARVKAICRVAAVTNAVFCGINAVTE